MASSCRRNLLLESHSSRPNTTASIAIGDLHKKLDTTVAHIPEGLKKISTDTTTRTSETLSRILTLSPILPPITEGLS